MLRRQRGTGPGATTSHIIPPPGGSVERRPSPAIRSLIPARIDRLPWLFDTIGRKKMISGTYMLAGVLLMSVMAKPPESIFRSGAPPSG